MRRRSWLAPALLVAAVARPAAAIELSEDPLEETSTDVGVIARAFVFTLGGAVLEPPINPLEDANPAASSIWELRLYASHKSPSWSFVIHEQLGTVIRSSPALGPLAVGRGVEPPRWLPLRFAATDDPTLILAATTDWAYATYTRGDFTLTAGRQPITFGRGKLWRPTDVVSIFALTEVDTEYKPGADALRVDWGTSKWSVTAVATTGELESDYDLETSIQGTTGVVRASVGLDRGEVAGTAATVRGDLMVGIDGAWDFERFDGYAEATLTVPSEDSLESPVASTGDPVPRAVLGATYHRGDFTLTQELWWNGFGTFDRDEYLEIAASPRVAVGEQITLGRAYTATSAVWQAHPLVTLSGAALINVRDPSALLTLAVVGSISDEVEASFGGYVPLGRTPEVQGGLPVARSEYGSYPYFFFGRIKVAI